MSPADPHAAAGDQACLTVHRTSARDEQSRQILVSLDGEYIGQLLYGKTLIKPIPPGPHTLSVNNTLFWKKVAFVAEAGKAVQFTVWNQPFGGDIMRMMFIFFGAAPLRLGFADGPPDEGSGGSAPSPAP